MGNLENELDAVLVAQLPVITTREELLEFQRARGLRDDWHEPDEQSVGAQLLTALSFDNAHMGSPPEVVGPPTHRRARLYPLEHTVMLTVDGQPVAFVNLAALFAFACGWEG